MAQSTFLIAGIIGATLAPVLGPWAAHADPALTVYNQDFAVVRDTVPLTLQAGLNNVQFTGATAHLEPSSVVLRDPTGQHALQLVEQNYRTDTLSQEYLLSLSEGKTINFRVTRGDKTEIVAGKVLRSGYSRSGNSTPLIEVDGQLQFFLPGQPIFAGLPQGTILKPTLNWLLRSETPLTLNAELAYVTGGMNWDAAYNLVSPFNTADSATATKTMEITGMVTLTNNSGKTFENAALKLMAGNVNRVANRTPLILTSSSAGIGGQVGQANVTQKAFDEYHLYSLKERTTLRDRETKQVEFLRAAKVQATTSYIYDGVELGEQYNYRRGFRDEDDYGSQSNKKIWVVTEFDNPTANGLGIPLPQGRLRFYQRDADGQMEFVGENNIDHTPQGEQVHAITGNAFDLVGSRKRTAYKIDRPARSLDESFEINLRNRKTVITEIRVIEHLYRGDNWAISEKSNLFFKRDSNTIEFRVQIPPDGEKVVSYTVHYTW